MKELMEFYRHSIHPEFNDGVAVTLTPRHLQSMIDKNQNFTWSQTEFDAFIQKGFLYVTRRSTVVRGRPRLTQAERAVRDGRRVTRAMTTFQIPLSPAIQAHFNEMVQIVLPPDEAQVQDATVRLNPNMARRSRN